MSRLEGSNVGQSKPTAKSVSVISTELTSNPDVNKNQYTEPLTESGNTKINESIVTEQSEVGYVAGYQQSSWRLVNVICLFCACIAQSSLMMQFSPVSAIVRDAYNTNDIAVSSNATVFLIILAILDLPSVYLLDSGSTQGYGMYVWFKLAALLTIVGQWGRYFALLWYPDHFWITVLPCIVMATGQPFLINGISKHACIWFGDNERALAIGIIAFGFALGSIVGLTLASFFVFEYDKDDSEKIRREAEDFMLFVSQGTTVLCTPMILFYRQRPEVFPSRSAEEDASSEKQQNMSQLLTELAELVKNRNFRYILIIFAIMNGSYVSLGTIINFLFEPFGYTSTDTSILGATFVICGLISSIIFPILIEKYHWFLRSLKIIVIGAFISSIIVLIAVPSQKFGFAVIAIGLLGFFVIPTMSVVYAFATELTYPNSEALFGSLLQAGSGIFGTFVAYGISFLINNFGGFSALLAYVTFFFICMMLANFIQEDLRRLRPKGDDSREMPVGGDNNKKTNDKSTKKTSKANKNDEQLKV